MTMVVRIPLPQGRVLNLPLRNPSIRLVESNSLAVPTRAWLEHSTCRRTVSVLCTMWHTDCGKGLSSRVSCPG